MRVRTVIAGIGRSLIALGVLMLLFVVYQLWGTGLAEQRDQKTLKRQFDTIVAPPSAHAAFLPPVPSGEAVAMIKIPKINLVKAVVEGVGVPDLQKGPGHYPGTPLPGQPGNAAIAGHRTTYGAPFFSISDLTRGDQIFVTTRAGTFEYDVDHLLIVKPTAREVLNPMGDNRLTLTTCHPRYSAAQRLILVANLKGTAVEPPAEPTNPPPRPPTDIGGADRAGLSGGATDKGPAIAWGSLAGLVWLAAATAGRRWRRWPSYLIATPVFLVVLFFFFENFARFLPANI